MSGRSMEPGGEIWGIGSGHGGAPVPNPLGLPSDGNPIPRNLIIYPPEVFPIPDAIEFNPLSSANTIVAETVIFPALSQQLPKGFVGIVRGFSIYIDNMLTTTDVRYSLLINGNPAPGYGKVRMFPRAAPSVSNGFDTFVRIPDGALLQVQYQNVDGGTYIVGASFSGWMWPTSAGERWIAAGY